MICTGKTILLVEDEPITAKVTQKILEKNGLKVIKAPTGEKALELASSKKKIDLILMDIDLGDGMDGTEAAEQILARCHVPLLFHSSHTEPEVVQKTEGITSYGYVVKNSGEVVLMASIKMALKLFDEKNKSEERAQELFKRETALAESEERFKALHNASFGGITIHDKGIILECNQGLADMTGYSHEELIGMDGLLLIAEKDRDKVMEKILSGYEEPYEAKGLTRNGAEYFLRIEARNIPYKGKTVRATEFRDITESKTAELKIQHQNEELEAANEELNATLEELTATVEEMEATNEELTMSQALIEESENRFRAMFSNIPSGVAVYQSIDDGNDFIFKAFNPAAEKMENIPANDCINKPVTEVFPAIEDFGLLDVMRRVWKTGIPEQHPISHYADGRISGWRDNYVYKLANGELVIIYEDITEKKQAAEEILASEWRANQQRKAITELVTDTSFITYDMDHALKHMTEIITRTMGVHRASVWQLSSDSTQLICSTMYLNTTKKHDSRLCIDAAAVRNYLNCLQKENRIASHNVYTDDRLRELATYLKKEKIISLLDTGIFVGGKFIGLVSCEHLNERNWYTDEEAFMDTMALLTAQLFLNRERKKVEIQLQHAQRMETVGRLAGGVAHDFNNLLSIILGYGEILRKKIAHDPNVDAVEQIVEAGKRASTLTRQLLTFSRKQVFEMAVVDINAIINDFEGLLKRLLYENINLKVKCSEEPCHVSADTSQIEQVFMNLIVNAQDAMPDGGDIVITVNPEHKENRVVIAVQDRGSGIAPEIIDQIFSPYFTTKEQGKGTGLGLATSYEIIQRHGGTMTVESTPQTGSTFYIILPMAAEKNGKKKTSSQSQISHTGSETVLLVEDEDQVRDIATYILQEYGYKVMTATNGAEALKLLSTYEGTIDLLLTDLMMPGMNGKELYDKALSQHNDLKVLFVSGYTDELISHHGLLDSGINFIQKPFTPESLTKKIRAVLDKY